VLHESGGTALAVSDQEIQAAQQRLARTEGIFAAPEGAATLAAVLHLRDSGWLQPGDTVVLFNTASGLKYVD
jgi:threonine synthase